MANKVVPEDGQMRIVVVGREGHGKSTVANALLGKEQFAVGTKTVSSDVGEASKNGITIKVVDTPDVSDNNMKQKEKQAEVDRWKELAAPFVSVLILVIKGDAPYTKEDFIAYRQVRRFWGGRGSTRDRLVVVFTFCDGQDVNEVGDRMENDSTKWMGKIFKDSRGRYLVLKGKSCGDFLEEVMDDNSDDEEEEESGSEKEESGSEKGESDDEGKGKGKKGKGKKGKGKKGKGKKHGHKRRFKPKGGRGRRRGHSGKGKKGGGQKRGGIFGILCCICDLVR